ncbi:amidase signature domain-containing protein [Trichoderma chlorosporum]
MEILCNYRFKGTNCYYICPRVVAKDPLQSVNDIATGLQLNPAAAQGHSEFVTIFSFSDFDEDFTQDSIKARLEALLEEDDVFSFDFIDRVYIHATQQQIAYTQVRSVFGRLQFYGKDVSVLPLPIEDVSSSLLSGPYAMTSLGFHRVWKAFADDRDAFIASFAPNDGSGNGSLETPEALLRQSSVYDSSLSESYRPLLFPSTSARLSVLVPSRCYYLKTDSKPLNGFRFAVKDNIHIRGCSTTAGSRDFGKLYGVQTATAKAVEKLVSMGAVLVGKTKTATFADGDVLTADWVEESYPWNPRGDGYLIPSGSSTGSAVAIAAYPWLDFTVGTDTLGSIRGPALWNGVYGVRPTWGSLDGDGVVPVVESFDTIGFFSRSLSICSTLSLHWLRCSETSSAMGFKLMHIPGDWKTDHDDIQMAQEQFILALEEACACRRADVKIEELWKSQSPLLREVDFYEYCHTVAINIKLPTQQRFIQQFLRAYENKYERQPYLNPVIRHVLAEAEHVTSQDYATALEKREAIAQWLNTEVMCVDADAYIPILVFPFTDGNLTYRDEYHAEPIGISSAGWHPKLLSTLGGIPEIVVPSKRKLCNYSMMAVVASAK